MLPLTAQRDRLQKEKEMKDRMIDDLRKAPAVLTEWLQFAMCSPHGWPFGLFIFLGPLRRKHNVILKLRVFCLKIGDVEKSHQKNWGGRSMCRDRNWHPLVTSKTSSSVKNLKSLEISEESYRRIAELVVSTYFLSPHGWRIPLSVFICCMFQDSDPWRCFTFVAFLQTLDWTLSKGWQRNLLCRDGSPSGSEPCIQKA